MLSSNLVGFSDSVRLVVVDHISSNYGLVFPVKVGWKSGGHLLPHLQHTFLFSQRMIALCHRMLVSIATDTTHC